MKRGQGIQVISDWIQYNKAFNFNEFIKNLYQLFNQSATCNA